ncbi:MAG: hypothetical protein GEU89_01670 [Kiloniellaceae bacterium]|nr:hypothetical protein [Kiloniellaceae bacterium]
MRSLTVALLACSAVALSACVTTVKEQHLQDGYRLLSGSEITTLVSGQTVEGRYGDGHGTYIDFRAADGRLSTLEPSGKTYIGTWEVEDDLLCLTYPTVPVPIPKCLEIAEKDGHYVEFRISGPAAGKLGAEYVSIIPGNIKNLPLE